MICPSCNKTVSKNDRSCPLCGYKLKEPDVSGEISDILSILMAQSQSHKETASQGVDTKNMSPEEKRALSVFMDTHNGKTPEQVAREQAEAEAEKALEALLTPAETPVSTATSTQTSTSYTSGATQKSGSSSGSVSSGSNPSVSNSNGHSYGNSSSSSSGGNLYYGVGGVGRRTSSSSSSSSTSGSSSRSVSTSTASKKSKPVKTTKPKTKDKGNFILNLICCIFPFVGIFYGISANSYYPKKAKSATVSSVFGIVLYAAIQLFLLYGLEIEQVSNFIIKEIGIK